MGTASGTRLRPVAMNNERNRNQQTWPPESGTSAAIRQCPGRVNPHFGAAMLNTAEEGSVHKGTLLRPWAVEDRSPDESGNACENRNEPFESRIFHGAFAVCDAGGCSIGTVPLHLRPAVRLLPSRRIRYGITPVPDLPKSLENPASLSAAAR